MNKTSLLRTALEALHRTGGHKLLAPITRGLGAILMLHRVSPEAPRAFDPNGILRVTPGFLEGAIMLAKSEGYDIVSLDVAQRRIVQKGKTRPFVCFTLDDGYRDNLIHAVPVFRKHHVPYCIYVPTAYAEGRGDLWWGHLEAAIAAGRRLTLSRNGLELVLECATPEQQKQAWNNLYWWLRSLPEDEARAVCRELCQQANVDIAPIAREMLTWDELSVLAADPLCTIGAHTVNHYSLAKLDTVQCHDEIVEGKRELERRLKRRVHHMSYPYGSHADCGRREFELAAEVGFTTAVTTHKGLIFPEHRDHLTALPRLSLNGYFQDVKMLEVLLGGVPFALINRFRRVAA